MARSDLLVALVRAAAEGDRARDRSTAEAIVADERAKNHHLLADRLQQAISAVALASSTTIQRPHAQAGKDAILEVTPRVRLEDLMLTLPVREAARQLIEEQAR